MTSIGMFHTYIIFDNDVIDKLKLIKYGDVKYKTEDYTADIFDKLKSIFKKQLVLLSKDKHLLAKEIRSRANISREGNIRNKDYFELLESNLIIDCKKTKKGLVFTTYVAILKYDTVRYQWKLDLKKVNKYR